MNRHGLMCETQLLQTPVTHAFSKVNLIYCLKFYELYSGSEIVPQLVEQFTKVKRGAAKAPRAFTEGYDPTVEAIRIRQTQLIQLLTTIQKGRARGTYYVPSEKLLMSTPQPANTTPLGANTTPSASNTIPLPKDIEEDLAKLKGKAPAEVLSSLIVRLCSCRPMTNEMLQTYLKRGKVTINKLVTPLVGKRIDYLFPMMPHHPNQAYVASTEGPEAKNAQGHKLLP